MKKTIILTLLVMQGMLLYAQKPRPIDVQIQASLAKIGNEIQAKLKPVFDKNTALQAQMQSDLKTITKIVDSKQLAAAIAAYQAKYKVTYEGLLKQAGVDMNKYAKDLNATFPSIQFGINNFAVIGKARRTAPPPPAPARPVSATIGNYSFEKQAGCGGAAFGSVTSTSNSLTSTVLSTIAGGCNNIGSLTATTKAPQQSPATIKVGNKAKVEAFAAAVGTVASSYASASYNYGTHDNGISVTALAPLLWVTYVEDEETLSNAYDIAANAGMFIYYGVYTATVSALAGESHSKATITNINNVLTTQP